MQFNLEQEFPILTTKSVAFKTAVKELLWIFQKQSNDVEELKRDNVHIWDEWEMEDRNNWNIVWLGSKRIQANRHVNK